MESRQRTDPIGAAARNRWLLDHAVWGGLILSILGIYAQVINFEFTHYDDNLYVYDNPHIQAGLTGTSIKWAFTAVVSDNWTPVTLLSHILDWQLFGGRSGMHHVVNVLLHALASVLLFVAMNRATKAQVASAFVAFVFALHPLHVGSVAWVAERKDVLSASFCFLALFAYVRYTERPSARRYLLMLGLFCLGLMSKPMLVTFPFALLLFDIWPLRRDKWRKSLWEKLPLIAISAASSLVTYFIQRSTGAVQSTAFPIRAANALNSYVTYLRQMFWPTRLAVFYPYPRTIDVWHVAVSACVILGVSGLVIWARRTRPYLMMGWFWYLGTLVPVVGLVQVGQQSHADRYTYIPMIGISVMLAWGAMDVVKRWPGTRVPIATAAAFCWFFCMVLAAKETGYWQNSEALFRRAIEVTQDNPVAHYNLGLYLMNMPGRRADAIEHFEAALSIKPDYAEASDNLGVCLADSQLCGSAIPHFEAALRAKPDSIRANNNLGACLINTGRYLEAAPHLEAALRGDPDFVDAHFNLGLALEGIPGRVPDAITQYENVLRLAPDSEAAHYKLGKLLATLGRTSEAISHLQAALRVRHDPEIAETINRLRAGKK